MELKYTKKDGNLKLPVDQYDKRREHDRALFS